MVRVPNNCLHIMAEGAQCGSPAMRQSRFCYHHTRLHQNRLAVSSERARNSRTLPFTLPVLEDADSIRLSLTEVMRALAAGHIDRKTASLMVYALQVATSNLPETNPCDA
jgi:hypothetical protein